MAHPFDTARSASPCADLRGASHAGRLAGWLIVLLAGAAPLTAPAFLGVGGPVAAAHDAPLQGQGGRDDSGKGPRGGKGDTKDATPAAQAAEARIVEAITRKEYAKALDLIDQALRTTPGDPLLHYNAACALALWGRIDEAAARLQVAVDHGFRDFQHMERDPDLEALRNHETYKSIVKARDAAGRSAAQKQVERWRARFGEERYRYELDERLNMHFATALDERMHQRMIRMLQAQADEQIRSLFAGPPKEAVFIAIPTRSDAREFFAELAERDATFDQPGVAGIYEHRPRRLVSANTGASLRHEFTHAMHYGDMERLGQGHPLWIQEGLATLYEDYDLGPDDRIVFLPNDRDETIRELIRAGVALPWRTLMALEPAEFMRRPQELYPQVRSIFRFVAAKGRLTRWYRAYTRTFAADRSGATAFEEAFDAPLAEIERSWRQWALGRGVELPGDRPGEAEPDAAPVARDRPGRTAPTPPVTHPAVDAPLRTLLGLALERKDGIQVVRVDSGSSAASAGVRTGDVILSIDGHSIESVSDAVSAIARRPPGDVVELVIRRDTAYSRLRVTLGGDTVGGGTP